MGDGTPTDDGEWARPELHEVIKLIIGPGFSDESPQRNAVIDAVLTSPLVAARVAAGVLVGRDQALTEAADGIEGLRMTGDDDAAHNYNLAVDLALVRVVALRGEGQR